MTRIKDIKNNKTYYITYDANKCGQPIKMWLKEKEQNLLWEDKNIIQIGEHIKYSYNTEGIRTKKETEEGTTEYSLIGSKIMKMEKVTSSGKITMYFTYDQRDELQSVTESNKEYYYIKDITGNIIKIKDEEGNSIVEYKYDAYGKVEKTIIENNNVSKYNPFIYKGYYYDEETELYYCNTRYYSPEIGRWISIDDVGYLDPKSINGLNLYCYCMNDPISYCDPSGHFTIAALLISIGISLVFEVIEDIMGDGKLGGDKDGWDYLGAGIAGFFGGLGGGLVAQAIFSVTGGLVDAAISGDLVKNGFLSTMGSIALSTVISFGAGALSKKISNNIKIKKLNTDPFNNRNVVRNLGVDYSFKKNGKSVEAAVKAIKNVNWISKTLWEGFSSNLGGSTTSFIWGLIF